MRPLFRHLAMLVLPLAPIAGAATISAGFEGASGTVDHFPGIAGDGWATGWGTQNNTNVSYAGAIATASPLDASPNYLSFARTSGTGTGGTVVRRTFTTLDDVSPAQPHRISFKYRFDGNFTEFNGQFNDRLQIFGDASAILSTATSNSWIIAAAAADNGTTNDIPAPNTWFAFDNHGNTNFTGTNLVNTGIALVPGTVYTFQIDVFPSQGKYELTLTDGVNTSFLSDLDFRGGIPTAGNEPDVIHFGANISAANDNHAFSIDSLTVTVAPEPGTFGVVGIAAIAALLRRRRAR